MNVQIPESCQPPFEDGEGNRTIQFEIAGSNAFMFTQGETTVNCTTESLLAFAQWHKVFNTHMERVRLDWDGEDGDRYFDASAETKSVKLCESFDSEHDYPGDEWPQPKYITLSGEGSRALATWVRLRFPKEAPG